MLIRLAFLIFISLPVFSQMREVINEDFNTNNGWIVKEDPKYSAKIENGKYLIQHKTEKGGHFFWKSFPEVNYYTDFILETRYRFVSGNDASGYGFIIGTKDSKNFQELYLTGQGYFKFLIREKGIDREMQKWKKDIGIVKPTSSYNDIKIEKVKNNIKIYINRNLVLDTTHTRFLGSYFGWDVSKDQTVEVDYLKLSQVDYQIRTVTDVDSTVKKIDLGNGVNTEADDYTPLISPDGRTLYFSRLNYEGNYQNPQKQDIYVSKLGEDGTWGLAYNIGQPLNNEGSNSIIATSADENVLFISNNYKADGSAGGNGISRTIKQADGWEIPKRVFIRNYKNNNRYVNFSFSQDQQYLIIATEMNDSKGDLDLYFSRKDGDEYTEPINIGDELNTFGTEMSPYLAADNRTLYFSSNGIPGYGSQDVFVTRRLDDTWLNWSEPENLGNGINSSAWEAYYVVPADGEYAYMAIHVKDKKLDLFKLKQPLSTRPEAVVLVTGTVYNGESNEPISAEIEYSNLDLDSLMGTAIADPNNGSYKIILTSGNNYGFNAIKEGFFPVSDNIDTKELSSYTEIKRDLFLYPISKGTVIRLNNVFFESNRSELQDRSKTDLKRLINLMNDNPSMKVIVMVHTDNVGSNEYNLNLSKERAKAVLEYLVKNGIDENRLESKGYGESLPVSSNDSDEGRSKNRRVEFKILDK